jgi:hypothetical protein
MFGWQALNKGLKHGFLLGLKLRYPGLRINYFTRLISYAAHHHRSMKRIFGGLLWLRAGLKKKLSDFRQL